MSNGTNTPWNRLSSVDYRRFGPSNLISTKNKNFSRLRF